MCNIYLGLPQKSYTVTLSPLYEKVDLLQLSDINNLELGKLMFKYSKQMLLSNFSLFFKNLNTRPIHVHQKIPDRTLTPN